MRNRAHLARLAGCGRSDDAPPGKEQCNQRRADEDRPIRLQYRQVADPSAAEPQGDQNQRPQAAGRGEDGSQPAGEERPAPVLWFRHARVLSNLNWIA